MAPSYRQPALKLTLPEVVASTRSLYFDEVKPFGRVLLKRLRERAAAFLALGHGLPIEMVDPESMPKIDPKRLRKTCERCPQLRVDSEDGAEFSVVLIGQHNNFVDVCNPHDSYPEQMWQEAAAYFQCLTKEDMNLPGGRYSCARELLRRGLPFLAERSLGAVCHIVQLAVAQKRILGYLEGRLVAYQHSEDWIKEQCAFHQQPTCAKPGLEGLPVASWEEARERLRQLLLQECNPEPGTLTLSNVKRLFRARFKLELSETALGHSRLFDLLRDVRFRDVCVLQGHDSGQLLVKRAEGPQQGPLQTPSAQVHTARPDMGSVVDTGRVSTGVASSGPGVHKRKDDESSQHTDAPTMGELSSGSGDDSERPAWSSPVEAQAKFRQNEDAPALRELSGCSADEGERPAQPSPLQAQARAIRAEEEESMAAFHTAVASQSDDLEMRHAVKNTFIDIPSPTSSGARRRLRSVPRDMGL